MAASWRVNSLSSTGEAGLFWSACQESRCLLPGSLLVLMIGALISGDVSHFYQGIDSFSGK